MRSPRKSLAIGVAAVGVALGSCSALGDAGRVIGLPTSPPGLWMQGCPAALLEGALVADDRWGVALATEFGSQAVRWPSGYYARQSGALTLHDAVGRVVASQGDIVYVGGGMDADNVLFVACGYVSRDPPSANRG